MIVRVNRQSLPAKPSLVRLKRIRCPAVRVQRGSQPKKLSISTEEGNLSVDSSKPLRASDLPPLTTKPRLTNFSLNGNQVTPVNGNEGIRKHRRCEITQHCCLLSIACTVGWLLILAAIIAAVLSLMQPVITTTPTTTTTSTTSTDTTTTATTTTTVTSDLCSVLAWNQTGLVVAGTGWHGAANNTFHNSACIYVDENYTMYVCDHHNERVQMWPQGATVGAPRAGTAAGAGATSVGHVEYLTMDKEGYIYVAGHTLSTVLRFAPGSVVGTTVASLLKQSSDVAVDDDFNLYVADPGNNRIMKWAQNATTGTVFAEHSDLDDIHGILLAPNSSNRLYLSSRKRNAVYLWTFGATSSSLTLSAVNSTNQVTLNGPLGMAHDNSSNLYVADRNNNRIVMFPVDSTVGIPILGECDAQPLVTAPMDVAFDNDQNLYVVLDGDKVLKYSQL